MTNSLVYNASKGAAHIMTLQMARELTKRYGITVFGVSPARLAGTGMSRYIDDRVTGLRGWTKEQADEYQRAALVTGKEIPPSRCAEFITWLLSEKERHEHLSGCVIPYGA
jgi:NAD(P)-dependent dehydrogenase (short-subunit alcohol dehydrogenase family)